MQLVLETLKSGPFTEFPVKVIGEVPRLVATTERAPLVVPGACGVAKDRKVRESDRFGVAGVVELVMLMKLATDGTPLLLTRKSM